MSVFQDIDLIWDGENYKISGDDKIMTLLVQIEEVITAQELFAASENGKIPLVKLSLAFQKVLNFVGVNLTSAEVYARIIPDENDQENITNCIVLLTQMMLPKDQSVLSKKNKQNSKKKKIRAEK